MTNPDIQQLSHAARRAVEQQNWPMVDACAGELMRRAPDNAEGYFLAGLIQKVSQRPARAVEAFEKALSLDESRYDAAVELANQYSIQRRNGDTVAMLERYESRLMNSPMYLDLAGTTYCDVGMPQKAWPLYVRANELQEGVDLFQANLAACGVYLGKIKEAREIYQKLLARFPGHRRNHWQLARLEKATDYEHVNQMKAVLASSHDTPDKNIFMYFAIGKELEDLGDWDEAFEYYKMGGDAVTSVASYDVADDITLIDTIIETCSADWLQSGSSSETADKTPIFIVGLPRTGTTLTERIVGSHSQVSSLGETQFLQMVLRRE
ncbi:MAG: sulfotransferase, partial [Pseudomonadales bacterium]|nr:sulfotransferase [Pseudomonadales bacterium]